MYDPLSHTLLNQIVDTLDSGEDAKEDRIFLTRLAANFHSIYKRFEFLYGKRPDFEEQLTQLVQTLLNCYHQRSKPLKKVDLDREAGPDWFLSEKLSGTMVYVDRFNKDLKGFQERIGYLKELGLNLVHIMPILKSPKGENDGGYAVTDYRQIDERFGTMSDFKVLVKELKENDMNLIFDLVINHTADDHEWARKAKDGNKEHQDLYYFFEDRTVPDLFEQALPEVFPTTDPGNFTFIESLRQYVMTVFHSYQWDLNYTNPQVFIRMVDILLYLANLGIDIIRIDAPAFIWKRMGTNSQNQPEAHLLLQMFKSCCQISAPGIALIAEAIVAPQEIIKYFGDSETVSNECDIAYNATLMALLWDAMATRNAKLLTTSLHDLPRKPAGTTWLNYARCHDDIGLGYEDVNAQRAGYTPHLHRQFLTEFLTGEFDGSFSKGFPFMFNPKTGDARISGSLASLAGLEKGLKENNEQDLEFAFDRILLLHSIIVSYGGIPIIYYGDEIGTLNDYDYLKDEDLKDDNRWIHRPIIKWDQVERRKTKGSPENRIFQGIKKLLKVRSESPEFADLNSFELIDCNNPHLFAYLRYRDKVKTLVVCNFKDLPQPFHLTTLMSLNFDPNLEIKDKFSGKKLRFKDNQIEMKPYQFLWIHQPLYS